MTAPVATPPTADPLAALRGYHLPDPVSWWPPAPGWWVLAALLMLLLSALAWWIVKRRRRTAAWRAANAEHAALRAELARSNDQLAFVRGLSKLLRRYALAAFPRRDVASLTGPAWLTFLDQHGGNGRFSDATGRQLLEAPYRPGDDLPVDELSTRVLAWMKHNAKGSR